MTPFLILRAIPWLTHPEICTSVRQLCGDSLRGQLTSAVCFPRWLLPLRYHSTVDLKDQNVDV